MFRKHLLPRYLEARSKGLLKMIDVFLKSQYYSKADLISLQEEKMRKLIAYAYENVPYYKEKFNEHRLVPSDIRSLEDLQKLPVLTKKEIKNDVQKMISVAKSANAIVRRTSGSTGTPYKVIVDRKSNLVEAALYYRFLLSMGYEWGDQIVSLWGAPIVEPTSSTRRILGHLKKEISNGIWNRKSFDTYNLDRHIIEKILLSLCGNTPKILRGYTSSVYSIALEVIKAKAEVNVKGVSTTAEKLFDYQRGAIETAFCQKVYDQYGCGESNSIAFECERHTGLHVASEHVILEILDDENRTITGNEPGKVIITDLDNYAMPLIRYENGDLARWSNDVCPCGRSLPLLQDIEGRIYEMLTVPGNKKIHGGFFDEIYIEMKLGDRYLIDDLRIVQEDLYNYRLEFVMEGKLSEKDVSVIKEKYKQYLGDVNVTIEYVQQIPPTRTGKRMFVIPASEGLKS